MPSDIKKRLGSGFFRYLIKPIKVREFMDTLDPALKLSVVQPALADCGDTP